MGLKEVCNVGLSATLFLQTEYIFSMYIFKAKKLVRTQFRCMFKRKHVPALTLKKEGFF